MVDNWETFRFLDEELQASLIAAIERAGVTHRRSADGAILYPPDMSIEQIIDQSVEAVFTAGYTRIGITDRAKAERYRRFKRHTGTPLIEEVRNGEAYFVQAIREKIYRYKGMPTHITFTVAEKGLDPDAVTRIIGLSPTFACAEGDPFVRPFSGRRPDAPVRHSARGWWELCSAPHVEANELEPHFEWLLSRLEPVASELGSLKGDPSRGDVRVLQINVVEPKDTVGGVTMSNRRLNQLGALTDRVDIRIWRDDYL